MARVTQSPFKPNWDRYCLGQWSSLTSLAIQTKLGWVLSGPVEFPDQPRNSNQTGMDIVWASRVPGPASQFKPNWDGYCLGQWSSLTSLAIQTKLGWVLSGPVEFPDQPRNSNQTGMGIVWASGVPCPASQFKPNWDGYCLGQWSYLTSLTIQTKLGWVLSGPVELPDQPRNSNQTGMGIVWVSRVP